MFATVRGHAPGLGIDCGDRLLQEANTRLVDVAVGMTDGLQRRPTEHHVELGIAEDEGVGAVDQGDAGLVAELLRQPGRELQARESSPEDEYARAHRERVARARIELATPRFSVVCSTN